MFANLTDSAFKNNPNAAYITGYFGDRWMRHFIGVGPSATIYKMKAVVIDGNVYIPNRQYSLRDKADKDFANYPMTQVFDVPESVIVYLHKSS
jgi:hypothetical protein